MESFDKNYSQYCLDLNSLIKEKAIVFDKIVDLYTHALAMYDQGSSKTADSYFKTLLMSGYLKNYDQESRKNKIKDIVNE